MIAFALAGLFIAVYLLRGGSLHRRGRRSEGPNYAGLALIALFVGVLALARLQPFGEGGCPMGLCTGSTEERPVTASTTLDGRWSGQAAGATYMLELTQSGSSVSGTGTREGVPVSVSGYVSEGAVQLDLGGAAFTGAYRDAKTIRGRVNEGGVERELVLRLRRPGARQG